MIGPPDGSILVTSLRVRSGEIGFQLDPWSVERNRTLPAAWRTAGSWGENWIG